MSECQRLKIPDLADYSPAELTEASAWPAIERYLRLLQTAQTAMPDDKTALRLRRHQLWLKCAVATYFDRFSAREVCAYWSQSAQDLIRQAWELSGCEHAGLGLLALGKLGAEELNLSSDVDLIILRPDHVAPDLKSFREFQSLLSDTTEVGFCLRTDFTLRPGGRNATAIPSIAEFEYHYGYHGEMWERLAYVRMRMLEGPTPLKHEMKVFAQRFSFRKHLDFTVFDDLKALRNKIRAEKFETRPGWFHLKVGEGGIREIELFVHALQILHGGRNRKLQTHSTTEALLQLQELKLLPEDECQALLQAYWQLRRMENRMHAFEDQQTYMLELKVGHPALSTQVMDELSALRQRVIAITTSLFGADKGDRALPESLEGQKEWLQQHGFNTTSQQETWPALLSATTHSQASGRDEQARIDFLQGFVVKLSELRLDQDLGLSLLLDFVRAIRAKASFFTLLNRVAEVRDDLALLFSISPYLGNLLASRPELIDEFIYRKQADLSLDFATLLEELAERRLLSELISASQFLADHDLRKMTLNLTANADTIVLSLLQRMKSEMGCQEIGLVALGKWGGRELGLRSDLDFIFVTKDRPTPDDHRLAKRFLSRITEPHRGGAIYAIDMRLRPSGQSGPIMVQHIELEHYLKTQAAAWERQAYLRSRPLCDLTFHPAAVASSPGLSAQDVSELKSIRRQLFKTSSRDEIDLKLSFGGLADVEFTAQIALLARKEFSLDPSTSGMIQYLEGIDTNWRSIGEKIRRAYHQLREIEQLFQLTTSQSGSKIRPKSEEFSRMSLLMKSSTTDLELQIRGILENTAAALLEVNDLTRS